MKYNFEISGPMTIPNPEEVAPGLEIKCDVKIRAIVEVNTELPDKFLNILHQKVSDLLNDRVADPNVILQSAKLDMKTGPALMGSVAEPIVQPVAPKVRLVSSES